MPAQQRNTNDRALCLQPIERGFGLARAMRLPNGNGCVGRRIRKRQDPAGAADRKRRRERGGRPSQHLKTFLRLAHHLQQLLDVARTFLDANDIGMMRQLGYGFGRPILIQQTTCEQEMRLEIAGLELHDFLQQFAFFGDVSLRPLGERPVEVTVWIARSEPGRKSEFVASLAIPIQVTENTRPVQVRDRQSGSDRNCGSRFRQGAVKVARVS